MSSLLLLQDPTAPYVARDSAGRVMPFATLTVYLSGTTQLAVAVYTADASGVFATIELDAGEYRIELNDAYGRLVWSVDPFTCDCDISDPILFRSPVNQTTDVDGVPYPGATLTFTDSVTDDTADVFANADLSVPLPNPLTANAGGWFRPVYLDNATSYRVVVKAAAGDVLRDVDPYVCNCGADHPVITSLDPPSVEQNFGAFTLTIIGTGFIASSVARWDGSDRTTTYISSTELEAAILAGDVDTVGTFNITVFNDDGGGLSNAEPFEVTAPPTVLVALSQTSAVNMIAYSLDGGTTWAQGTVPAPSGQWRGVAFSPTLGYAIAVSDSGVVVKSTDGITWTTVADNLAFNSWGELIWAANLSLFVICGVSNPGSNVATSPDGVTWTVQTTPAVGGVAQTYRRIWQNSRTNRIWAATAGFGSVRPMIYSDDGINWSAPSGAIASSDTAGLTSIRDFPTIGTKGRVYFSGGQAGNIPDYYTDDDGATFVTVSGVGTTTNATSCAINTVSGVVTRTGVGGGGQYTTAIATPGPPSSPWVNSGVGSTFECLDMIYADFWAKFIGVSNTGGLRVAQSVTGLTGWTSATPLAVGSFHGIRELAIP